MSQNPLPHTETKTKPDKNIAFNREIPADDPEASLPLHGPNQWPSEQQLPGFRATITAYFDALLVLGHKLLRLLALSLDLPGGCAGVDLRAYAAVGVPAC